MNNAYWINFADGTSVDVCADNLVEAIESARSSAIDAFIDQWNYSVQVAGIYPEPSTDVPDDPELSRLCAVDQNEVVCAHPGCTGPYHCKERGLQG